MGSLLQSSTTQGTWARHLRFLRLGLQGPWQRRQRLPQALQRRRHGAPGARPGEAKPEVPGARVAGAWKAQKP